MTYVTMSERRAVVPVNFGTLGARAWIPPQSLGLLSSRPFALAANSRRMILDEPRLSGSHQMFPPRPPLSEQNSATNSRLHDRDGEPLLPYAFRHGQASPASFDHYPGGASGVAGVVPASWVLFGSGRGRFKLLVFAASACLLFLL